MVSEHHRRGGSAAFHISMPHPSFTHHHTNSTSSTSSTEDLTHTTTSSSTASSNKPDTPHPQHNNTGFLDSHSSKFRQAHHEYTVNHDFRAAKKEARKASRDTQIPELMEEPEEMLTEEQKVEQLRRDREEFERVMKGREAARRRNTLEQGP